MPIHCNRVVFLLLAILAGNYFVKLFIRSENIVEQPSVKQPIVETQGLGVGEEPQQSNNIPKAPEKVELTISAKQECWLEVNIDGMNNFFWLDPGGEEKVLPGKESVYLTAGNAGGRNYNEWRKIWGYLAMLARSNARNLDQ